MKSEFRHWIKNRIDDFGFVENQDFVTDGKNLPGGGRQTDYHITLDMAKELSMVERNDKGKQARQYFIDCERKLKETQAPALPTDPIMAMLAATQQMREQQLAMASSITTVAQTVQEIQQEAKQEIGAYDALMTSAPALSASNLDFKNGIAEAPLFITSSPLTSTVVT